MNSGTIKRIFISDIHMGDERSAHQQLPAHNYCWFYASDSRTDRPEMLTRFLEDYCISDGSLAEVVIVGDLFDEWVCPASLDPTEPPHPLPVPPGEQYRRIVGAGRNLRVVKALKSLASMDKLVYVPGNHDMFAEKSIMEDMFPGIRCPGPQDGHCFYKADGIWTEHGHWYGLFNAPHPAGSGSGFEGSMLPLGHFVTRINTEEALRTGATLGLPQVFKEWIDHIFREVPEVKHAGAEARDLVDAILRDLLNTLVSHHAYGRKGAVMNGFADIPGIVLWEDVMNRYAHLYAAWPDSHPDNVGRLDAIFSDAGDLSGAARLITFQNEEVNIVVCGHTHQSDLVTYEDTVYPPDEVPPEAKRVYANSGSWTNDTPTCTFVETELRPNDGIHLINLREWVKKAAGMYEAGDIHQAWVAHLSR
jgi:UDP-2,3-diacylglucosamine pyrophosphatase LpxH